MKTRILAFSFFLILLALLIRSCLSGRTRDDDELVLHEMIVEKNGMYYWGDCETHATEKYSGTDTCYYHENGKIKATYTIINGLPDGHWEQFDSSGAKTLDLYFDKGEVVKKNKCTKNKKQSI